MILYIIKSLCCSAVLLGVYHLFFEKEKMHRFNRFYLLFSMMASFCIPLITIEFDEPSPPVEEVITIITTNFSTLSQQTETVVDHYSPIPVIIICIYAVIAFILLFRFVKNLMGLFNKIKSSLFAPFAPARLVLLEENIVPHSFLKNIFLNKQQYEAGYIEPEILQHELTHVQQKHSYDILLIEVLQVFAWFNPFLYLYKKAVRLNHEFLADEAVVSKYANAEDYQHLLLASISRASGISLTSQLNYLVTKKRLVMITKKTSFAKATGKQLLLLPVFASMVFLFSTTTTAQEVKQPPSVVKDTAVVTLSKDKQEQALQLFEAILKKYKLDTKEGFKSFHKVLTKEDREKLELLYKQLSKEMRDKQKIGFMPPPKPFNKMVPSEKLFTAFKNPDVYGVWLDNKKISNGDLEKYSNTDFSHYMVSKLYGAAKKGRTYTHQLNLMTNAYYKKYYDEAILHKENIMFVKWTENNKESRLVAPYTRQ